MMNSLIFACFAVAVLLLVYAIGWGFVFLKDLRNPNNWQVGYVELLDRKEFALYFKGIKVDGRVWSKQHWAENCLYTDQRLYNERMARKLAKPVMIKHTVDKGESV